MGLRETALDEEAHLDPKRINDGEHDRQVIPISTSPGDHLQKGSLKEQPYWTQSYESSVNLYSRSPSISTNASRVEPSVEQGVNGTMFVFKHNRYNEFIDDAKEPLLMVNGHRNTSLLDSYRKNDPPAQLNLLVNSSADCLARSSTPKLRQTSVFQAVLNGLNVLAGVGILSMPYAVSQGGWIGLSFLLMFAVICCYTGILLRRCIDSHPSIMGYPGMGQAAFGTYGRLLVSTLLYLELFAVASEFLILEGDNFAQLIDWSGIEIMQFNLTSQQSFIIILSVLMLPTVCLRDLRLLSYISAGGVISCVTVLAATVWYGISDSGFTYRSGNLLNVQGLPIAVGLYAFCYCGHAVFPNIYCSMEEKAKFNHVLIVCFVLCTFLYGGMAAVGYLIFGGSIESQVTLSLPKGEIPTQVAIVAMLISPFAKYALTLMPVAGALEELLPHPWRASKSFELYSVIIRTLLVATTVGIAIAVPLFAYIMALVGSFLSITVAITIPCLCYLKLFSNQVPSWEKALIAVFLVLGTIACVAGTYTSLAEIADNL